jgi:hypothetical protein
MTEQRKPDLSQIEPLGRVPDADDQWGVGSDVDRTSAAITNTPDAGHEPEPRTSPETEERLEQLRRG